MSYYGKRRYEQYNAEVNRLPSGLFFTAARVEHMELPAKRSHDSIKQKKVINHEKINYDDYVVPKYNSRKIGKEIYLPMLEVSVEVEVVATIAWSKLTQTFTNRSKQPIKEATYCMPLYDKSTVTSFVCTIGSDKILKGTVKPKEQAKAEFKKAVAKEQVAALLEEHTAEVFETTVGNIPAETTVKVEISYITELKADLGGDGVLVTIPTSVAPRYGAIPSSMRDAPAESLAVPEDNGLQIKIQVSSPVAITKIESRTHPVSIEMGSHGTRVTKDIRDFSKKQESQGFDPKKALATLSDRNACLGKDFVLLIQANDRQLLASRAISEPHPTIPDHSALMVSINLRDLYTPNVVSPKTASEIIFVADRSGSMKGSMEALKTAMKFFLKSLPNNCIFNICSFGSTHKLMWPKSQPYNQETVDQALTYVANDFAANMGGTEIQGALRYVVENSEVSVATEIITLTDGRVWDTPSLFDFIQKTRSSGLNQNTRFFCLGIGDGVSHHLVAGIGRYGGGLAEVVLTDSSGDWMQRVIGMLRAALTPSSWTVEVTLDSVSTSAKESENKGCIQAPHHNADLHAFSRSSVYFLLNQEFEGKVVKIKATSIYSGETFTAEIPIEKSDIGKKWVHQLAAKAVLGDLESGQSWIHDKSKNTTDTKTKTETDELAKIEGEKIGIEWNISSKWTSFIVVDEKSSLEKQSRWYQTGHSDLAELTRPRFEPKYDSHILASDARLGLSGKAVQFQGYSQPHGVLPYRAPQSYEDATPPEDYSMFPQRSRDATPPEDHWTPLKTNVRRHARYAPHQIRHRRAPENHGSQEQQKEKQHSDPKLNFEPIKEGSYLFGVTYSSQEPSMGRTIKPARGFSGSGTSRFPILPDEELGNPRPPQQPASNTNDSPVMTFQYQFGNSDGSDAEAMAGVTATGLGDDEPFDFTYDDAPYQPQASMQIATQDLFFSDDSFQTLVEPSRAAPQDKFYCENSTQEPTSMEKGSETLSHDPYFVPSNPFTPLGASAATFPDYPIQFSDFFNPPPPSSGPSSWNPPNPSYDSPQEERCLFAPPQAQGHTAQSSHSSHRPRSSTIPRPNYSGIFSLYPDPHISPLTLPNLLTTQHVLGYFSLTEQLWIKLNKEYKHLAWTTADSLLPRRRAMHRRGANDSEWLDTREKVVGTAMVVVYIEVVHAADKNLWDLVVQKARAWLEGEIPHQRIREKVLGKLRGLLITPCDEGGGSVIDEVASISAVEAQQPRNDLATPGYERADAGVGEVEGVSLLSAGPGDSAGMPQEGQGGDAEAGAKTSAIVQHMREARGSKKDVMIRGGETGVESVLGISPPSAGLGGNRAVQQGEQTKKEVVIKMEKGLVDILGDGDGVGDGYPPNYGSR
ncbi:hypothetical protein V501_00001 [Pseudogymnoascus sp. VKM F-4519 (FW-2642)]|nr:hypothetical protein V501_00001 [Pseudogymnoascus sp. VKM F-4519 (FW-2642)]